ncbi:MAG: hypothetical protein K9G67_08060 [Bacteroidales bacterium]|nr:hypothetical protein [Bacteroidales bacterium]MCF8345273.1 hypothetical protein [Bacteroidales bacterium]MCF8349774.1 hypothetical protein [Bacteroidales bacterium]MCF8376293.1 hypothetical protein [Bacteroidales bacterium]MCF8400987.1 hypothetical protein [Bacteroidales bacterium]
MKNQNNDILKHLISGSELEKAPEGFTASVMYKMEQEQTVASSQALLSPQHWLLIGLGLGVAVIVMLSMDFGFLTGFIKKIDYSELSNTISASLISIKSFFRQIALNSNALVIFGSLILLVLFDRLLKKRFSLNLFSL